MKTMTLNLSDKEMEALEKLCNSLEMSKTATMKLCLRTYQCIHVQASRGWTMDFVDPEGRSHKQFLAESFIGIKH